jgi:hypothetical protein
VHVFLVGSQSLLFCFSCSFLFSNTFIQCSFSLPLQTGFRSHHRESSHFGAVTRDFRSALHSFLVLMSVYVFRRRRSASYTTS